MIILNFSHLKCQSSVWKRPLLTSMTFNDILFPSFIKCLLSLSYPGLDQDLSKLTQPQAQIYSHRTPKA